MMGLGLRFGWRLLSSRAGLAVVLCALLWGWHVYDKRQAINAAREGFVQQFELTAAQAELDALRRRMAAAAEANRALQERIQVAEGEALRFATELEAFEHETQVNPDGVVDTDLLRRLRSN
ncbi:hypothetical protein AIOL_001948 [Candidatus Rhodobacter oscarellae]|uniref:Uncharacterized protein n=1 Tax=Candidatus Rhodobacter oscarellae TaxID=1675527 RepID=A0A0J9E2M7_9RHOB|nr:hypothetical protein [Candidatus Rhodobacter lobularis]KMW56990.1 hypothetical protein AIOL_001948 [Candidatus Rhodobacter lobularis]